MSIVVDDRAAVYPLTIDPVFEAAKLTASDAAADDYFGSSVFISGDTAIVGAYGNSDAGDESGSAYIFTGTVHNVTQDTVHFTIQSAIDQADSGDQIEASPGTYHEAINFLGKAITLRSSDGPDVTTIDASGVEPLGGRSAS